MNHINIFIGHKAQKGKVSIMKTTLFNNTQFTKLGYMAERYVREAIKAFDNEDYDQFMEMVLALESMEKRNLIEGCWSQKLFLSATHNEPEWFTQAQEKKLPKWEVILAFTGIDPAFVMEEDEIHITVHAKNCDEAADKALIEEGSGEVYPVACYPA